MSGITDRRDFIRALGCGLPACAALPYTGSGNPSAPSAQPPPLSNTADHVARGKIHDVTDFGARGDGEADDTEAIQAAIDARRDESVRVYFPSGTYLHTGLSVQTSAGADGSRILMGDGTQSRLVHTGEGPSIRAGLVRKPGLIEFRSLHIDGGDGKGSHGIHFDRTRTVMVMVRDCGISHHGASGIYSLDSWHTRIVNCLIVRNGDAGIWLSGSNGPYIWANTVERNPIGVKLGSTVSEYEGATSRRVQGGRLSGMNIIQRNDEVGVLLREVEGVSVTGNYFEANGVGIRQENSINNLGSTIRENRFNISDHGCAVELMGGRHVAVRHNTVVGGGGGGDAAYQFAEPARAIAFERGYVASTVSAQTIGDDTGLSTSADSSNLSDTVSDNHRRITSIERALRRYGVID